MKMKFIGKECSDMLKKKIAFMTAFMLSAGIVCTVPSIPTVNALEPVITSAMYGKSGSENSKSMKDALALVKSQIDIPAEYSDFSYSSGEKYSLKSYRFTWNTEPNDGSAYEASVTGGIITEYYTPAYRSRYTNGTLSFSPFTAGELEKKALEWIYKVNPCMKGLLKVSQTPVFSLWNDNVTINFHHDRNGVRVLKDNVRVTVNKMTGEVVGFMCDWWEGAEYVDTSMAISQKEIQDIYRKEITLKPWYRLNYNDKTKKTDVQIVYVPESTYVYDAVSGGHTTMNDDYTALLDTDKYFYEDYLLDIEDVDGGEGIDGEGDTIFSPEELAAIQEMEGLLKESEFKALAMKDPYMGITEKYLTSSYSISPNAETESGYMINAEYMINNSSTYGRVNVSADAKSGRVYSFYRSGNNSKAVLDVTKANALAGEAAEYYYGSIISKYKADPNNTAPAISAGNYKDTSRTMRYYRYENNIQVSGEYINISVNSDNIVTSVQCSYTKGVDFGDGKILSPSAALDKLFEQMSFKLNFDGFKDLKSRPHTYLNYTLDSWSVNAKSGILCDYFGNKITFNEIPADCPYTDIKKSPYKDEILTLYNHGIRKYTDSRLEPDKTITSSELDELLGYVSFMGTPIADENATKRNAPVTRRELAKQLVIMSGLEKSAELKGIYRSPFKDIKDSDENVGYIAIAYALGAVDGDSSGNFDPDGYVTREYALHCLYNYILHS